MDGYILIHRKIADWQWYKYSSTLHLFMDLLLDANWQDSKVGALTIKRGQCLTSLKRMSLRTGLSYREIRTSLSRLQESGEIDKQTTNKYSIITIKNYNDYQDIDKQKTNKRQTKDNIKEYKEEKKEIKNKESIKKVFTKPTLHEITDYCLERNNNVDAERFYNFYESKDWYVGKNKMKDWKACIRTWEQRDKVDVPSWFGKEIKERERTEDEERELQELIRGY